MHILPTCSCARLRHCGATCIDYRLRNPYWKHARRPIQCYRQPSEADECSLIYRLYVRAYTVDMGTCVTNMSEKLKSVWLCFFLSAADLTCVFIFHCFLYLLFLPTRAVCCCILFTSSFADFFASLLSLHLTIAIGIPTGHDFLLVHGKPQCSYVVLSSPNSTLYIRASGEMSIPAKYDTCCY